MDRRTEVATRAKKIFTRRSLPPWLLVVFDKIAWLVERGGDMDFIATSGITFLVFFREWAWAVGVLWLGYLLLRPSPTKELSKEATPPTHQPAPTTTGSRPVITALDDSHMRLLIANEGERGVFTAQCTIVRGNTGEGDVSIPVEWELRDKDGSTEIACGQDNWLRIQRAQIQREIPFRGQVEIASGGMVESSTGGKAPLPENPWIELEVNISADGRQLIERFLWCSCCGFRALGSIMP